VIGEPIDQIWTLASTNLEAALQKFGPHLAPVGASLLSAAAGAGLAVLQFVISIVIAGVLLARSGAGVETTLAFSTRLAGERGAEFTDLAAATVRSVTQGILGVAFIQASLVGIGFAVYGVPHAGLWALLCLILAIVQLPPLLIVLPILLYEYSAGSTGIGFFVFATWSLLASASDNVLKPILLSRGLDLPMLVIFMGAIGGFMRAGFIGLFVGAIVLALGYKLTMAWLEEGSAPAEEVEGTVA
jgi:predicted PurR-regulated permease PerM